MKSRKKLFLVIVVVLLCGSLGYWKLSTKNDSSEQKKDTSISTARPRNTVDYSPSNSEDNAASEARKSNPKSAASTLDNGPASPESNTNASITITGANPDGTQSIRVSSIVDGATSGTCNYSFSKSQGGTVEKRASANITISSHQYYSCPPVSVAMPSKGSWYVSVSLGENGTVKNTWANNPVKL